MSKYEVVYRCKKCQFERYLEEDLKNHSKKPCRVNLICVDCGRLISSYDEFLKHDEECKETMPEKIIPARSYCCEACGKLYHDLNKAVVHTRISHSINLIPDEEEKKKQVTGTPEHVTIAK